MQTTAAAENLFIRAPPRQFRKMVPFNYAEEPFLGSKFNKDAASAQTPVSRGQQGLPFGRTLSQWPVGHLSQDCFLSYPDI